MANPSSFSPCATYRINGANVSSHSDPVPSSPHALIICYKRHHNYSAALRTDDPFEAASAGNSKKNLPPSTRPYISVLLTILTTPHPYPAPLPSTVHPSRREGRYVPASVRPRRARRRTRRPAPCASSTGLRGVRVSVSRPDDKQNAKSKEKEGRRETHPARRSATPTCTASQRRARPRPTACCPRNCRCAARQRGALRVSDAPFGAAINKKRTNARRPETQTRRPPPPCPRSRRRPSLGGEKRRRWASRAPWRRAGPVMRPGR